VPELPEVETTRRGIAPHISGQIVSKVIIRQSRLRWPVPARLKSLLPGQTISEVTRRGKYLLLHTDIGTVILHLGMSGSLRLLDTTTPAEKHDHVDIVFSNGMALRLRDPRRFGAVLWTSASPAKHPLLSTLGPEPLTNEFNVDYLFSRARKRRVSVKEFIMDSKVVVGVGNIYASESLYLAGIRPTIAAGRITKNRYQQLVTAIKQVLTLAIRSGGTTLRDFQQQLNVYDRAGEPCHRCGTAIRHIQQGQRSSYYCPHCQQ
jgi:formamidopyrimidine-DNA glycosylase